MNTPLRQQLLNGYVLHHRPYRESSQLLSMLTQELGRLDGVVRRKRTSLYQPMTGFASGKSTLRSLTQLETTGAIYELGGAGYLAGFYANELLMRLLPIEEPVPAIFTAYEQLLQQLVATARMREDTGWITALRTFEHVVLDELGYAIDWEHDWLGLAINPEQHYVYRVGQGFEQHTQGELGTFLKQIAQIYQSQADWTAETRLAATRIQRAALHHLLGDKPLKSRELWRQLTGER